MNGIMGMKWKATLYDDNTYMIEEVDKNFTTPEDRCMCMGNGVLFVKETREEVVKVLKQYIQREMLELDSKLFSLRNLIESIK